MQTTQSNRISVTLLHVSLIFSSLDFLFYNAILYSVIRNFFPYPSEKHTCIVALDHDFSIGLHMLPLAERNSRQDIYILPIIDLNHILSKNLSIPQVVQWSSCQVSEPQLTGMAE